MMLSSSYNAYKPIPDTPSPRFDHVQATRSWRIQVALINSMEFAAESSRGIVMPTLFLYCQSVGGTLADMGILMSIFSIGRLVSSMVFGYLCDRPGASFRFVYMVSLAISVVGNIMYLLADSHVANSKTLLVVSRFIVGVGAGNRSVCRADIARLTSMDQRLTYLTLLSTVVFLGYALTPGLGEVFVGVNFTLVGGISIHELNAPGLVMAAFDFLLAICMWRGYSEVLHASIPPPSSMDTSSKNVVVHAPTEGSNTTGDDVVDEELSTRLFYFGVAVFVGLNIIGRGVLSIFETISVPLYLDVTRLSGDQAVASASAFQFNMGLLGLLSYLAIMVCRRKVADSGWLLLGLAAMVVGNGLLFFLWPLSFNAMALGIFFVWSVGSPLITTVSLAAFSKILGSRQQGTWMGILGSSASMSRIVLPLLPALFDTFAPLFVVSLIMAVVGMASLHGFHTLVTQAKAKRANRERV
ncbi:hypothetical protein DYB28_005269 [Aphanomyces astaci]|uniref:Major facilitator superfamily (MFS) profile domain-containing protein n=1 Tax=Aphanomyces astaci TaxID=112090 RepID=A0A9X8HE69_APHAT|nr:hypothetical protein DYB28_005269 [Aphanomyces astaci]